MLTDDVGEALTFDDLLLVPAESAILPKDVDTSTSLTANISLRIPILTSTRTWTWSSRRPRSTG